MDFWGSIGPEWFMALGSILLINLVLSGDNAVIIALASKNLPVAQRRKAILWGSLGAVILRIILTFVAAQLLEVPFLQFLGGLALLYISFSLLRDNSKERGYRKAASYREAIKIILVADLIMSLDNVLALAAISQTVPSGKYGLITMGLTTSIPLVVFGAQLLIKLMNRFPSIIYLGAGILGYAAAELIVSDEVVGTYLSKHVLFFKTGLTLAVIISGYLLKALTTKIKH
ncbi:TerC family protein [Sporomusa termitida]|uniref:Integral membrane protein, YjbE family n=1 Tax=Sporomusa termitida TaxID=2377 RepID=A0A517DTP2_9FIRM|nr:TerC family protein [Sporomusa termitida]QDR80719.1 integral membrane protein, YjbE family [Sporomusa termitida]